MNRPKGPSRKDVTGHGVGEVSTKGIKHSNLYSNNDVIIRGMGSKSLDFEGWSFVDAP